MSHPPIRRLHELFPCICRSCEHSANHMQVNKATWERWWNRPLYLNIMYFTVSTSQTQQHSASYWHVLNRCFGKEEEIKTYMVTSMLTYRKQPKGNPKWCWTVGSLQMVSNSPYVGKYICTLGNLTRTGTHCESEIILSDYGRRDFWQAMYWCCHCRSLVWCISSQDAHMPVLPSILPDVMSLLSPSGPT